MSEQSDQDKRKEILRQLKQKEKTDFFNSLPMYKDSFRELFDFLDKNLGDGCDDDLTLTTKFLEDKGIKNIEQIIVWLKHNGGYCDCEVLANVEERFE